jgi:hypothetical protein
MPGPIDGCYYNNQGSGVGFQKVHLPHLIIYLGPTEESGVTDKNTTITADIKDEQDGIPTASEDAEQSKLFNFNYDDLVKAVTERLLRTQDLMYELKGTGVIPEQIGQAVASALIGKFIRVDAASEKRKLKEYVKKVHQRWDHPQTQNRDRQIKNFSKAVFSAAFSKRDAERAGACTKDHPYYLPLLRHLNNIFSSRTKTPLKHVAAIMLRFNLSARMPCEDCQDIWRKRGPKSKIKNQTPDLIRIVKNGWDMCGYEEIVFDCPHFDAVHHKVREAIRSI